MFGCTGRPGRDASRRGAGRENQNSTPDPAVAITLLVRVRYGRVFRGAIP